jgi:hypothetical protein
MVIEIIVERRKISGPASCGFAHDELNYLAGAEKSFRLTRLISFSRESVVGGIRRSG